MVIKAKQRFYFTLFTYMALLGICIVSSFTVAGNIPKCTGWPLVAVFFCIAAPLFVVMVREKIRDWHTQASGHRVQGRIQAVEANVWLNTPVIIHYVYQVGGKEYEGSTWTTIHYLKQVPPEGASCQVVYDKQNPQRSVVEDLLC